MRLLEEVQKTSTDVNVPRSARPIAAADANESGEQFESDIVVRAEPARNRFFAGTPWGVSGRLDLERVRLSFSTPDLTGV